MMEEMEEKEVGFNKQTQSAAGMSTSLIAAILARDSYSAHCSQPASGVSSTTASPADSEHPSPRSSFTQEDYSDSLTSLPIIKPNISIRVPYPRVYPTAPNLQQTQDILKIKLHQLKNLTALGYREKKLQMILQQTLRETERSIRELANKILSDSPQPEQPVPHCVSSYQYQQKSGKNYSFWLSIPEHIPNMPDHVIPETPNPLSH